MRAAHRGGRHDGLGVEPLGTSHELGCRCNRVGRVGSSVPEFSEREDDTSLALIYSLHLLARAPAEGAHDALLRLLCHSGDTVEGLIGGAVTEDLG